MSAATTKRSGIASKPFMVCVGVAVVALGALALLRDRGLLESFEPRPLGEVETTYEAPRPPRPIHFEGVQRVGVPAAEDIQTLRQIRRESRRQKREIKRYREYTR